MLRISGTTTGQKGETLSQMVPLSGTPHRIIYSLSLVMLRIAEAGMDKQ